MFKSKDAKITAKIKENKAYIEECQSRIEANGFKIIGFAGNFIDDTTILGRGLDFLLLIENTNETVKLASARQKVCSINKLLSVCVMTVDDFKKSFVDKSGDKLARAKQNHQFFLETCHQIVSNVNDGSPQVASHTTSTNPTSVLRFMR